MGGNFSVELKRLLAEAGCRFERHGKGDHAYAGTIAQHPPGDGYSICFNVTDD